MLLPSDMLQAIDERVRSGERNITAMGTITSRTFDDNAMCTFDGSQSPIPVKVFGTVEAYEGDRVGLLKFGNWWVVVGSMTKRWPSEGGSGLAPTIQYTTSSATYVDVPEATAFTFVKRWNLTRVRFEIHASARVNTAGTRSEFAAKFTSTAGTWTHPLTFLYNNIVDLHLYQSGIGYIPGGVSWGGGALPEGTYSVLLQWRMPSGVAGQVQIDTSDRLWCNCYEVSP